jgi:hypothetical protein
MQHPPTRIGFSTAKGLPGLVSRVVSFFSGAKVSHAWLLYYDLDFREDVVMEAHEMGFRLMSFELFKKRNNVYKIFIPKSEIDVGLPSCLKWLGTAYDFAGLVGMTWVMLGRLFRRKWRNPFRNRKAQFCSEAVIRVMQAANYSGSKELSPDDSDPGSLLAFLEHDGSVQWLP